MAWVRVGVRREAPALSSLPVDGFRGPPELAEHHRHPAACRVVRGCPRECFSLALLRRAQSCLLSRLTELVYRYTDTTSEWTLDYPPFFAWFEYVLAQVAHLVDPRILELSKSGYSSEALIIFQAMPPKPAFLWARRAIMLWLQFWQCWFSV